MRVLQTEIAMPTRPDPAHLDAIRVIAELHASDAPVPILGRAWERVEQARRSRGFR